MAELLAASTAIGVASSLISFAEVGWRIVTRLNEYNEGRKETPAVFRTITAQLPLVIEKTEALKRSTKDGFLISPQSALAVAVVSCDQELGRLNSLTSKLLPVAGDSKFNLAKKAFRSVKYEKDIASAWSALQTYISTFTFHFTEINAALAEADKAVSKVAFTVPFERDRNFVGRSSVISEINQILSAHTRVALAGIGGIGKSQIAIEYCYQFKNENPDRHVFWIHASTPQRFCQAYSDIARQNAIPGWDDPKCNHLQLVCEWLLKSNSNWLLVLDNADNLSMFCESALDVMGKEDDTRLIDYLPKSPNGLFLITTRDKRVGETLANGEMPINVPPMDQIDAETMLRSKISYDTGDEADTETLLHDLEYLPLAITQAAAFIRQNNITITKYLEIFHADDAEMKKLLTVELSDPRRDSRAQNSIVRTWKLSFDQIASQDPYAAKLLSFMAVLDRHGIPTMLLRRDEKGVVEFTTAIGLLQVFSLIEVQKDSASFEMHRLVQLSTQTWLEIQGKLTEWQEIALDAVTNALPYGLFDDWKICESLLPHAQTVLTYDLTSPPSVLQRAKILYKMSFYDDQLGNYNAAALRGEQALELCKRELDNDHPNVLACMNSLAMGCEAQGHYAKAEGLILELLEIRKRVLGNTHPDTLTGMNNLAVVYSGQCKYTEAADLLEEVVQIQRTVLGDENLNQLASKDNLALIYSQLGQNTRAKDLQLAILNTRQRLQGDEHPNTLVSLNNLALTYSKLGDITEAVELQEKGLKTIKRVLGDEHPETLIRMMNLALSYSRQGPERLNEATDLQAKAFETQKRVLGEKHPSTLLSMKNLALMYWGQDHDSEAVLLLEKASEGFASTLGQDHEYTINAVQRLKELKEEVSL